MEYVDYFSSSTLAQPPATAGQRDCKRSIERRRGSRSERQKYKTKSNSGSGIGNREIVLVAAVNAQRGKEGKRHVSFPVPVALRSPV